jgi:cation diffusion facilitator CzcD-associated flavoprotein CzcO
MSRVSTPPPVPHTATLIVGAGFAGVAMAIQLRQAGDEDWHIIERSTTLGGTWRDNAYPGAACDVQSVLYSYSFAPAAHWSRRYAPQREIEAYLTQVADDYGIAARVECGAALEHAQWDGAAGVWRVGTTTGPRTATVLVLAGGALADPKLPDLPGLDTFGGPVIHTAMWGPAADAAVADRLVGVIGTGASAVQVVPAIAGRAAAVEVYQRSAPWVLPRRDRSIPQQLTRLEARVPLIRTLRRGTVRVSREAMSPLFTRPGWFGAVAQHRATAFRQRELPDPALAESARPAYRMGCKRVLISDDYYAALRRRDVDLVTDPIVRVEHDAVVTRDAQGAEREHQVDTLVCATGFLPMRPPIADRVAGSGGRTLGSWWDEVGVQAYKGTAVPGYPNLFFLVGPNTGLGHTSMLLVIEAQVGYVGGAIEHLRSPGRGALEVRAEAHERWNTAVQRRLARAIWSTGGCSSWYLDRHGRNVTLWPGTTWSFARAVRRFDPDAYREVAPSRATSRT